MSDERERFSYFVQLRNKLEVEVQLKEKELLSMNGEIEELLLELGLDKEMNLDSKIEFLREKLEKAKMAIGKLVKDAGLGGGDEGSEEDFGD